MDGHVGHASAETARAEAALLAGERYDLGIAAAPAHEVQTALFDDAALEELLEVYDGLLDAVARNVPPERLNFTGAGVGDNGARDMARALATNTSLVALDLSSNKIGDEGALALADALKINRSLREVDLFRKPDRRCRSAGAC